MAAHPPFVSAFRRHNPVVAPVLRLPLRRSRRLRHVLALTAALAGLAAGAACRPADIDPEAARALAQARRFQDSLVAAGERAPRTARDTAGLLALGYLERARLGIGSPFRLLDQALVDPRLPAPLRDSTAWALLAMVYDGAVYQTDTLALDSLFSPAAAGGSDAAAALVERLERAVLRARDPRVGEHAVRLTFALLGAEGLVRSSAQQVPARVAAQLRDRRLAREDLLRLFEAAREAQASPVQLVPSWRLARRFAVEQPVLGPLTPEQEVAVVEAVPSLLDDVRTVAAGRATTDPSTADASDENAGAPARRRAGLSPAAAERLAALPQAHALPPQAAVTVALAASRERIVEAPGIEPAARRARVRFVSGAVTEELLAAEYARLGAARDHRAAQAMLWAAVSVRPHAQEEPWFPGSGGPTLAELRSRFRLATVTFDAKVPAEWRPYYRRMLATAAEDLRRVLPDFSLEGVTVHFGRQPLPAALAVHDPRTRTIYLPLSSGAGALAHELAHDLDWQVAARRFARRGEYSTDQAVREQRGRLAASLRGLTSATLMAPGPENQFRPPHAQRPTEVFASSVDWFVAAGLARMGRMNGFLTTVQDDLFTGFADVRPPDARGDAGEATVDVLGEMTALPADLRQWFRDTYGRGREASAPERARRVLELAAAGAHGRGLVVRGDGRPHALPPRCVARELDEDEPLRAARRRAAELAADAVARRLLAQDGLPVAGGARVAVTPNGVPALPVDPALVAERRRELRDRLLSRVQRVEDARSWLPAGGFDYAPYCE